MKRILVVGLGSIGRRHLEVAAETFPATERLAVSSRGSAERPDLGRRSGTLLSMAEALARTPDVAIIASPAPWHLAHADRLLEAGIPVLVEKPLSDQVGPAAEFKKRWEGAGRVALAYHFRFSRLVQAARDWLLSGRVGAIKQVQVSTAQYLPQWRPDSDYRRSVSANRHLGGGVLLELSHELDLIHWLLGPAVRLSAALANSGSLDIDTEDRVDALIQLESGALVNLHLDMLQRIPRREWSLTGEKGTLRLDLVAQTLDWDDGEGGAEHHRFTQARNDIFSAQLRSFVDFSQGGQWRGASVGDGVVALEWVAAIRRANAEQRWVSLNER